MFMIPTKGDVYANHRMQMSHLTTFKPMRVCLRLDSLQKEMLFDVYNVPGDGNCFFYCMAYAKLSSEEFKPTLSTPDAIITCK